jgi:hypothetical protein
VTLEIGDYILTPEICVERKSISDLIGKAMRNVFSDVEKGCQIFLNAIYKNGDNITKCHNICVPNCLKMKQIVTKYTHIPNSHKRYQNFPFQGLPIHTNIVGFGMKLSYLATISLYIEKRGLLF